MISDYILHTSIEIGLDRISSAIVFGKLLEEHKEMNRSLEEVADTLLMVMNIDDLLQVSRDYKNHIHHLTT